MNVGAILARSCTSRLAHPTARCAPWKNIWARRRRPEWRPSIRLGGVLVLACLGHFEDATERAKEAEAASHRTEVAGQSVDIDGATVSQRGAAQRNAPSESFRASFESGNIDAFVAELPGLPQHLPAVAADKSTHRELRLILSRAQRPGLRPCSRFPPSERRRVITHSADKERK